jgi:hypothetical protein
MKRKAKPRRGAKAPKVAAKAAAKVAPPSAWPPLRRIREGREAEPPDPDIGSEFYRLIDEVVSMQDGELYFVWMDGDY